MKKIFIALVTVITLAGGYRAQSQVMNAGINFNTFYDELSPYGHWINYPDYGQVWVYNEMGFEPYSNNGHWEYTNLGWTWVSDYAWGWAPFHYGRWTYLPNDRWAWVPGYEWAPAWVSWCQYDGYYGWAPLSPGLGVHISFNSIPLNRWQFVQSRYINDPYVYRHYSRPIRNSDAYRNVVIINNTKQTDQVTYMAGPQRRDVERVIQKKIEPRRVTFNEQGEKKESVVNNEVRIYRPAINKNTPPAPQQNVQNSTANAQPVQPMATVPQKQAPLRQQNERTNIEQLDKEEQPQQTKNKEINAVQNKNASVQGEIKRQAVIEQQTQQTEIKRQQEQLKQQQAEQQRQQQMEIKKQQQEQLKQQQAEQQRQQQMEIKKQQQAEEYRLNQQEMMRQQQNELRQQQRKVLEQNEMKQQQRTEQQQMRTERKQNNYPPQQQATRERKKTFY